MVGIKDCNGDDLPEEIVAEIVSIRVTQGHDFSHYVNYRQTSERVWAWASCTRCSRRFLIVDTLVRAPTPNDLRPNDMCEGDTDP